MNIKQKIKLLKAIDDIMSPDILKDINKKELMPKTLKEAKKINKVSLMDYACICSIEPLNQESYSFLVENFCNYKKRWSKELRYDDLQVGCSLYTFNIFEKLIEVFKSFNAECIFVEMGERFPIQIWNKENDETEFLFKITLAPRDY